MERRSGDQTGRSRMEALHAALAPCSCTFPGAQIPSERFAEVRQMAESAETLSLWGWAAEMEEAQGLDISLISLRDTKTGSSKAHTP